MCISVMDTTSISLFEAFAITVLLILCVYAILPVGKIIRVKKALECPICCENTHSFKICGICLKYICTDCFIRSCRLSCAFCLEDVCQ